MTNRNLIYAGSYFALAALLTFYFIGGKFWLYSSENDMLRSASMASAKWVIQIIAVLFFLKTEKWVFIKRIGFICFTSSATLYLYYPLAFLPLPISGFTQFAISIFCSVIVMIVMYYKAVIKTGLPLSWFWGWLICLSSTLMLQEAFVFK